MKGFGAIFHVEYLLLAAIFRWVAAQGAYFSRRLARLAEAERRAVSAEEARAFATRRQALQRLSYRVSLFDVLISAVVVGLAVNT